MPVQNYRVQVSLFGPWPRGAVLPEFVVRQAGPVEEVIRQGIVSPTGEEVTRAVIDRLAEMKKARAAEAAKPAPVPESVEREVADLRARLKAAAENAEAQTARADRAEKRIEELRGELIDYAEVNNHLKRAADDHQATIERLEKELADARKPAPVG
jgi:predicted RNase H-like nuclease (RuvC/YqgF family)